MSAPRRRRRGYIEQLPSGRVTNLDEPAAWTAFVAGYECGIAHGIDMGRAEANQGWTDVTTAACRAALANGLSYKEMERRRADYPFPALAAEEIHRRAEESWVGDL